MQPSTSAAHLVLGVRIEHDERILDAPVGGVGHVRRRARGRRRRCCRGAVWRAEHARRRACAAPRSRGTTARSGRRRRAPRRPAARPWRRARDRRRCAAARGASRSRAAGGAAPRPAAAAASGCRAGRPAGRDCARRPRCRPAPRTASAPSGRCAARRAARPAAVHIVRAEQADDDLAVGERRVVVRDLAQARRVGSRRRGRGQESVGQRVHDPMEFTAVQQPPATRRPDGQRSARPDRRDVTAQPSRRPARHSARPCRPR